MRELEEDLRRTRNRIADLEAELRQAKEELVDVQAGLRETVTGVLIHGDEEGGRERASTISNLEEMVLLVNPDRSLGYVNAPMARLLGMADRREALGDALSAWDHGALGEGTLGALCVSALAVDQVIVVERHMGDLPVDRLSPERLPAEELACGRRRRPGDQVILRFVATPMKGRVQITVQDVTWLRWLEATFSRFVSPRVIEQMLARPSSELLDMQRRVITMLYVDLRGFTRLSQTLSLGTLQAMMNQWFAAMQDAVEALEGTVGQFVGDQVVALFGAPLPRDDHALAGLLAGVAMQASQERLHLEWADSGWPTPGIGIGVATGEVAVGNMGSERHMYYTALGLPMNLGARLCAVAEAGEILTVPTTHQSAIEALRRDPARPGIPRLRFTSRGVYRFKNVLEPSEVLSVSAAPRSPSSIPAANT